MQQSYDIVIIGAGPAGYTAAFRAADLLKSENQNPKVALIEKNAFLGGVCLNEGCIPSKSLLHLASLKSHIQLLQKSGFKIDCYEKASWDLNLLKKYQKDIIHTLRDGIKTLATLRKIDIIQGTASFLSSHEIQIVNEDNTSTHITFSKAIIATGSLPRALGFLEKGHPKLWDSKKALEIDTIPESLIILGGGVIGCEMAQIYHGLGSNITIIESSEQILNGIDKDLAQVVFRDLQSKGIKIITSAQIQSIADTSTGISVEYKQENQVKIIEGSVILESVGRKVDITSLGIEKAGISHLSSGFISVDPFSLQTSQPHIYGVGDLCGGSLLAHKAISQGKIAAEHACGLKVKFEPYSVVSVVYTDPELAWIGPTEQELNQKAVPYKTSLFPWKANGRAIATHESQGLTKIIYDPISHRIIAGGICGSHAGDLIGELVLAVEMGAFVEDVALSIHPHPSTSETIMNACEMALGTITDLLPKK